MGNRRKTIPKAEDPEYGYKYDKTWPDVLVNIGKKGDSIPEFCVVADICETTYWRWVRDRPEFKAAHYKAKTFAKAWWLKKGKAHIVTYVDEEGAHEKFDTSLFKFITGGRFGLSHQPEIEMPELGNGSLKKQSRDALKALARGQLTPNQAVAISTMLKNAIDVEVHDEFKQKLTELEKQVKNLANQPMISKVAEEPEYEVIDDSPMSPEHET